jgi:hypothetical protein
MVHRAYLQIIMKSTVAQISPPTLVNSDFLTHTSGVGATQGGKTSQDSPRKMLSTGASLLTLLPFLLLLTLLSLPLASLVCWWTLLIGVLSSDENDVSEGLFNLHKYTPGISLSPHNAHIHTHTYTH